MATVGNDRKALGLRLDAPTGCAGWLGERLLLAQEIDVLRPLVNVMKLDKTTRLVRNTS